MASPRKSDSTDDSSLPSRDYQRPVDTPVQTARPDQRSPPRPSSRARPCGYDCEFVERPPPQLHCECPVCLQVLRDPQQVTCCGNSYCKVCIGRVVNKNGKPCPTCNAVTFSIFPNKGLRRTLGGFRVYCSNKDEGCEWVGELGDIERHLNSKPSPKRQLEGCLFEEVVCVYCACLFQRRYIHDHQSNKCPKRQFQCEHCGEIDSYENITEIHSQNCPSFPIACRQHCGKNVQRQEMDNHVSRDCPLTKIDCVYKIFGCEVRPARKDLSTHITERVADHTAMLAKSIRKVAGSAKAQSNKLKNSVTELLDTVSKQQTLITSLQNENKELKTESADEKFQNREHVDQLGRESAEHINQLIRESDERMNQFKRENDVELSAVKRENQAHFDQFQMVIDYYNLLRREIDDRINQLRRENDDRINQLRRENDEKLMAMKRQHFKHMFLGLAVVLAIVAIGIGVVSHRGDVKLLNAKLEDSFASLEVQLETEIERKMTDFDKTKTANAPWYSPPFYTHTHGYKMCINVIANGCGFRKMTHVSVYLFLMPGIFDDDLEWPFRGHITIELVNRLNRTSNIVKEIHFSENSDRATVGKVTSGVRAVRGRGWDEFIACSKLNYNAYKQTQYLKHDSLIFRISKVTNVK